MTFDRFTELVCITFLMAILIPLGVFGAIMLWREIQVNPWILLWLPLSAVVTISIMYQAGKDNGPTLPPPGSRGRGD